MKRFIGERAESRYAISLTPIRFIARGLPKGVRH